MATDSKTYSSKVPTSKKIKKYVKKNTKGIK
jgi:hypothetical protein